MFKFLLSFFLAAATSFSQTLPNDNGYRPAWALDRIDQREATLDDRYNYSLTGQGVNVYVFDSGINSSHEEFEGRVDVGYNVVTEDSWGTEDCSGHGSHSASIIGGKTYGVAKSVRLIPVRVLNCRNINTSIATLYDAFDWIINHHQAGVPAVVNMSVSLSKNEVFNSAVRRLIEDGLIVVGAAGNNNRDACLYSPASEPSVITVGGTDPQDLRGTQSNWGTCVDIFAPGWDVVGAWTGGTNVYRSSSGTSNAAPIVSGIAALMLQVNPLHTQNQIMVNLKKTATVGALFNVGEGSSNLLAYSGLYDSPVTTTTTTVAPTSTTVAPTTTTIAPTTTTVAPVVTNPTTTTVVTISPEPTVPVERPTFDLNCTKPAERTIFYGVPYVCVNTGNQLMWIPKRYSPGRP